MTGRRTDRPTHPSPQAGFIAPTVLFMLLGAFSVALVSAVVAVSSQRGTDRDAETKTALALAEAGVSEALLHYNRVPTTALTPCVASTGGTLFVTAPTGDWCPSMQGGTNQGTYEYSVKSSGDELEIVSVGQSEGVTRRVKVDASSVSGSQVFSDATVKAREHISLDSFAEIHAGTATNGGMTLASNAKLCGPGAVGVAQSLTLTGSAAHHANVDCTGTGTTINKPLVLPAVNQGEAATVNDNGRFFSADVRTGGNKVAWNPSTRAMTLSQNSSLTLGGSIYSFCTLELSSNTALYAAPGANVTIFFDSPEACGLPPGATQLKLASNSRITSTGGGPANLAMLFVGSDSIETRMELTSNTQVAGACEQNFVIYAPRTNAEFNSNSTYCGAIAVRNLVMDSNVTVYTDAAASSFVLPNTEPHYEPTGFVECSSREVSPPDAEC